MKYGIHIFLGLTLLLLGVAENAMAQTITIKGNVYGGGEVAQVEGDTKVTVTNATVPNFKASDLLSNPKYSVFGGGLGKTAIVTGDTYVDVSMTKGNKLFEVIGGGMNGSVGGTCNVHIGNATKYTIYNVYGGGYYAPVGNTSLVLTQGKITNDVYGGGVMGSILGTATTKIGLLSSDENVSINDNTYTLASHKNQITIGGNVYGGNDVGGSVNTTELVINGGTIEKDVYGAGNGNHPGYTNPSHVEYLESQHTKEAYRYVVSPNQNNAAVTSPVYKYRPRTTNVNITIAGNDGKDFNDPSSVDKVRILGRTFGGGNSCNVGEWDENDKFVGGGTLNINIGSHVQLGTANESDQEPVGLFMGSNGQQLVTQSSSSSMQKYYNYYRSGTQNKYVSGFNNEASFLSFVDNILIWTDDVHLNIADTVVDVWLSNFVGGGFRGSMKAKTANGSFDYKLPGGVTVGNTIIGGAFNAYVAYRTNLSDVNPKYLFEGGMLAENSNDISNRTHVVHADPRADGLTKEQRDDLYKTNYFTEPTEGFFKKRDLPLVKLHLYNMLQPLVHEADLVAGTDLNVHGGNVYGGCFNSGNVEGDSWIDYSCYLSPLCTDKRFFDKTNMDIYGEVADLERNNALMVFGAGYGEQTESKGDVYLNIYSVGINTGDNFSNYPYLFNAFGGSNKGTVVGNTNVFYSGGKQGTLLGSLYGGGLVGEIKGNTFVELAGGFVVNVYGGSRQANIGGASHVWAYDGKYNGIDDVQHLIICNLYGGNDLSGTIHGTMPAVWARNQWSKLEDKEINSYVEIAADNESAERGFPLVGSAFAGGNGENWNASIGEQPNVERALIEIDGGTTIRAFGGGNMATVTEDTYCFTNAQRQDFANVEFTGYQKNIMNKVFFGDVPVGYRWSGTKLIMDPYHVVRLFGGNNLETMDIQPTWHLKHGRLDNVYSGGNMGKMTYYNPTGNPATKDGKIGSASGRENSSDGSNANYSPRGLSITIDQPDVYIGSLFGGCRMSDVNPTPKVGQPAWPEGTEGEDFYGVTVNILDGYIENVYGGNDISGTVYHGTNVNIAGAVSGNVYGSGNGYYLYKWEKDATQIEEKINPKEVDDINNFLYYTVPANSNFGGKEADDTQKLLTINAARPSVQKSFLNIAGNRENASKSIPKRIAYVKGNVYCGGNASTVSGEGSFTKFKIGSYVTLNGVFMGCDGEAFSQNAHIAAFEEMNDFDMGAAATIGDNAIPAADAKYYPNLLSVFMKAVEMEALPKDFSLKNSLTEAHLGTFCGGGNRGSMLTDKTVSLPIHHSIIVYDKVVAGCLNANVNYTKDGNVVSAYGGFTRPVADPASNTKMNYTIAAQFAPLMMDVPADKNPSTKNEHGENFDTAIAHNFLYSNFSDGEIWNYEEYNDLFDGHFTSQEDFEENAEENIWKVVPGAYAPACNIYGGCYQSGEIEGDVILSVHSNMLRYVNQALLESSLASNVACFNIYGAGFGQNSHVWGNVKIIMDRSLDNVIMGSSIATSTLTKAVREKFAASTSLFNVKMYDFRLYNGSVKGYPSANNIFGGGRNGQLIGNSQIEIRNGLVYTDVVGGCFASNMYGSSQIVIGYPKYYECTASGEYQIQRGDIWNTGKIDYYGNDLLKGSIFYLKGDLVPENVYQQIIAKDASKAAKFNLVDVNPTTNHTADGTSWDDVYIKIGKGIYGGGYSLANSTSASAGNITTHKLGDGEVNGHKQNFNGRHGYEDMSNTIGYGGNSCIMVGDRADEPTGEEVKRDHIQISTIKAAKVTKKPSTVLGLYTYDKTTKLYTHQGDGAPVSGVTYYKLSGDGGIYGDGHLTFCEGFRAAEITRYGWTEGTPKHPVLMNTFQRLDLLSVNDCCLMLQGAQDFATDQVDATIYSLTRVNELRMNSTIDPTSTYGSLTSQSGAGGDGAEFDLSEQRNYVAFFNNVRYLGSMITNDEFDSATFHKSDGSLGSVSYMANKRAFIKTYHDSPTKDKVVTDKFKERNVGTARNAIGVNNGYCLRIQNQEYVDNGGKMEYQTYYGPIVGVCEVKLLSLTEGEGGGYVYADNIHDDKDHFLNTSGNFVFPGIINNKPELGNQYIVDDCFYKPFGTKKNLTTRNVEELDEAHYWYVEGNKYFYNTTLTGFTYQEALDFNLTENDPNILLSGLENGSQLNVKRIEWLSAHRDGYESVLQNSTKNKIDDYEFDIEVGGKDTDDWRNNMPRYTSGSDTKPMTTGKTINNDKIPQFNIHLQDKLDNSGKTNYVNHLDEPELVKIYLEGMTKDENGVDQKYEYTITLNIVYLQGPSFEGGVDILNCALPGEMIGFSSKGIKVETPELMPITSSSWQVLPLEEINEHGVWKWDNNNGVAIPKNLYEEDVDGNITGAIPALYKQNEYNIAFIFTAGGKNFPVMPDQTKPKKEQRMIVVHNYHRMKEVVARGLQIEKMPNVPNHDPHTVHASLAEAKLYIEDEADLRAFVEYLNMATAGNANRIPVGLAGLDIILQKDIVLTESLPAINQSFAGTFHGDGYHIDLGQYGSSFFGGRLSGKVYNLGVVNGTVASSGTVVNSYELDNPNAFNDPKVRNGNLAYDLSHKFSPSTDQDEYVASYYANGDYQYASTNRIWSLRNAAPNYGRTETRHNIDHTHDAVRWQGESGTEDVLNESGTNIPVYNGRKVVDDKIMWNAALASEVTYAGMPEGYANDYLFFGQHLDKENGDAYPMHINQVATGDEDMTKGGNRVFATNGYYQSKTQGRFCYNKDAWALDPTLTAIDYTQMTAEGDGAATLPTKFSVDSNKDYSGVAYDNEQYGHVTQNLLVYNAGENVFDKKDVAGIPESSIVYHNIVKGSDGKFSTAFFHLVDKQDFNAPITFNVKERAWYERLPLNYRSGESLAWEGICIPFTAKKVYSMMENPDGGADIASEISHFYGKELTCDPSLNDHTLHHEYWLNGMVDVDGSNIAFTRPSTTGEGLFKVGSHDDYKYQNDYFIKLPDYNNHFGTRDDAEWYAQSHTFADYVYLTNGIPYLVAFPGADYYEFDLTAKPVIFESSNAAIAVSDDETRMTTIGKHSHHGAYLHEDAAYLIDDKGNAFDQINDVALPFRTYMTVSSGAAPYRLAIVGTNEAIEEEEDLDPVSNLEIYTDGMTVYVSSPYEHNLQIPVYMSSGHLVTIHTATPGLSSFRIGHAGVYLIGGHKFLLK